MEQIISKTVVPVSVIIPCFRCSSTINRAITSVLQQTQQAAEVILVDDASHDNTLCVLQNLAKQYQQIKVIALTENQGAAHARNVGWSVATQPYIAFLDADDAWHPCKLEIQYSYMSSHPMVTLSGHGHRIIYDNNLPNWQIMTCNSLVFSQRSWLLSNKFITPSVMVRRDVEQRFSEQQRYMEDYGLWLEFVYNHQVIVKLSAELAAIYKHPFGVTGLSANLWAMEQGELQNYRHLYNQGFINFLEWLMLSLYSLMKFLRRLIIYWGRLQWKT